MRCVFFILTLAILTSTACRAERFSVLVFTKTAGFRHDSIPDGVAMMQQLADQNCFTIEHTEDAAAFDSANLARFRVVMFLLTTGDVLDDSQQAAMEAFIRAGGGFVGIHSAADTEYDWPFYGQLIGAYFASHPQPQDADLYIEDANHPATIGLPSPWRRFDEWYNFQHNPRPNVHVLMRIDESSYSGGTMGVDHPIAWCDTIDSGRAFYTAGGHTSETYSEPLYRQHVLGGLFWAAGFDQVPTCIGDVNCNGTIELADLSALLSHFGTPSGATHAQGDLDGDGDVDLTDLALLLSTFGHVCP